VPFSRSAWTEKIPWAVRCPAGVVEKELNTGDLQATREGAGIPCSISHPETPDALRRGLAAGAGGHARRPHDAASSPEAFAAGASRLFSNSISLVSRSPNAMRARTEVTKPITCVASPGDRMPPAQTATTAWPALTKSPALSISGRSNATGRSRRTGKSRPTQKHSAAQSPAKAFVMSRRVSSSAAPSSTASSARMALLRDPFGRPLGRRPEGSANGLSPRIGVAPAAGSRSCMAVGSSPVCPRCRLRLAAAPRLAARGHDSVESGAILSSTEMVSTQFLSTARSSHCKRSEPHPACARRRRSGCRKRQFPQRPARDRPTPIAAGTWQQAHAGFRATDGRIGFKIVKGRRT
jgi:hypothetical protein